MPTIPTPANQGAQVIGGVRQTIDPATPRQSFALPDVGSTAGQFMQAFGGALQTGAEVANDYFRQVEERRQTAYMLNVQNRVQQYEDGVQQRYRDPSEGGAGVFGLAADQTWFDTLGTDRASWIENEITATDDYQRLSPENQLAVDQFLIQRAAGFNASNFRWHEAQTTAALAAEFEATRQLQLNSSINDPSSAQVSMGAGITAVLNQLVGVGDAPLGSDQVQSAIQSELESHFAAVVDQMLAGTDPGRAARTRQWVNNHQSITVTFQGQDVTVDVGSAILDRANNAIRAATPGPNLAGIAREYVEGHRDPETGQIDAEALFNAVMADESLDTAMQNRILSAGETGIRRQMFYQDAAAAQLQDEANRLAANGQVDELEALMNNPENMARLSNGQRAEINTLAEYATIMTDLGAVNVTVPEVEMRLTEALINNELETMDLAQFMDIARGGLSVNDLGSWVEVYATQRAARIDLDTERELQQLVALEEAGYGISVAAVTQRVEGAEAMITPILNESLPMPTASATPEDRAQAQMLRDAWRSYFVDMAARGTEPLTPETIRNQMDHLNHPSRLQPMRGMMVPSALSTHFERQTGPSVLQPVPTGGSRLDEGAFTAAVTGTDTVSARVAAVSNQIGVFLEPGTAAHEEVTAFVSNYANQTGQEIDDGLVTTVVRTLDHMVDENSDDFYPDAIAGLPVSYLQTISHDLLPDPLSPGTYLSESTDLHNGIDRATATYVQDYASILSLARGDADAQFAFVIARNPGLDATSLGNILGSIPARAAAETDAAVQDARRGLIFSTLHHDPDMIHARVRELLDDD